ncbi:MAG TPA: phosphate acyltransferase, partial [Candidatus Sabulitectum sp.]|nr:phosphate acyltransferase [Candidatus Sabulitectum sp.]
MSEQVVVALDAMGGDHGPGVVVEGAVKFFRESPGSLKKGVKVILVGNRDTLARMLSRAGGQKLPIE